MNAFVIVDPQNDFINGALGSFEAASVIPRIVERLKKLDENWKVIVTKDTHFDNYKETNEGRHLPVEHCIFHTHGWNINPYLIKELGSANTMVKMIKKCTFGSTDLQEYCMFEGFEKIEICGFCTDVCVIANALLIKSALPESDIIVDAKLCAGTSVEMHEAALKVMKSCQIDVVNMPEW